MAMVGQHMHERTKLPVKNEQEKSARVKTENKVTSKSLFYGTSLALHHLYWTRTFNQIPLKLHKMKTKLFLVRMLFKRIFLFEILISQMHDISMI